MRGTVNSMLHRRGTDTMIMGTLCQTGDDRLSIHASLECKNQGSRTPGKSKTRWINNNQDASRTVEESVKQFSKQDEWRKTGGTRDCSIPRP